MARGAGQRQTRPRCWFCSAEGLTDEHIFARSFTSLFGIVDSVTGVSFTPDGSRPPKIKRSKQFAAVARIACADCNNGWMNRLDDSVRPTLQALVLDIPVTLLAEGQGLLATWASKVMFAMVSTQPEPDQIVPRPLYRELNELGEPPSGVQVWLGAHPRDHHVHFVGYCVTLVALDGAPGFILSLSFGHAVFVLMHHGHADKRFSLALLAKAQLPAIWPPTPQATWPPASRIRDPRLENLELVMARPFNEFRPLK